MSKGHKRLAPSNHRWPHCPGSIREEAAYPDIAGEAAIDGTGSHELLELCIKNNVKAIHYDGAIIAENHEDKANGWLVDAERCKRVQMGLDYIERRVKELKIQFPNCKSIQVESESFADPGGLFGRDDWGGTCDVTITVLDFDDRCLFLEAIDYKDGRVYVDVKGNTQLYSYLIGKARPFIASGPHLVRPFYPHKIHGCRLTIVQPKTNVPVRYEEPTVEAALELIIKLDYAADLTDDPNAPLIPDDKGGKGYCRWCKHKNNCNAQTERSLEKVNSMTTQETTDTGFSLATLTGLLNEITTIDPEVLVDIADTKAGFMAVFEKIDKEIERRIEAGETVNGYAMTPGKGSNVWNETEEKIVKALKGRRLTKGEIYPSKLITPAACLKLSSLDDAQKKKIQEKLISFKAGTNKLTRIAYEKSEEKDVTNMFDDIPQQQSENEEVSFDDIPKQQSETEEVSFF